MPQHRKSGFNPLSDRRQAIISLFGIAFGNQQTTVFFEQFVLQPLTAVTEITDHRAILNNSVKASATERSE